MKQYRRVGCLPWSISIAFHSGHNKIEIFCDAGRLARPVFYTSLLMELVKSEYNELIDYNSPECFSLTRNISLYDRILKKDFKWEELLYGTIKSEKNSNLLFNLENLFGRKERKN